MFKKASDDYKAANILLCRTDRLGDVILTTPAIQLVRKKYPDAKIGVLVSEYAAPLFENAEYVDELLIWKPQGEHKGFIGWFRLVNLIRKGKWDVAVVFYLRLWLCLALFFARVKERIGPLTKAYAFFLMTVTIRQHRSRVELHEADYNIALLSPLGINLAEWKSEAECRVAVSPEAVSSIDNYIRNEMSAIRDRSPVIVHTGMGGSALNWPFESWKELVRILVEEEKLAVILTAHGFHEEQKAQRIVSYLNESQHKHVHIFSGRPIAELAALMSRVKLVIAPSTGPLHLGVAVGTPVLGIYPPVKVQSVFRWGPYLPYEKMRGSTIAPDVNCGQRFQCAGMRCIYYECMPKIFIADVVEKARSLIKVTL